MGHFFLRVAAIVAVIVGVAAMLAGSIDFELGGLYRGGLALALLGGGYLLAARSVLIGALVERARQNGYDDGYSDACNTLRPSRLRLASLSGPLGSAAHEFGDESDLGSGSERVG